MNINGFEVEKFNIHNIPENAKYHTCPECSHTRKKNTDKCMSVFWDTGLGRCNHCGAQVQLHTYKKKNENSIRQYVKPANVNTTNLDDRHVEWFESRGISQSTLRRAGISSGATYMPDGKGGYQKRMAIMFNYIKDGELTNIKYRDGDKNFKLVKDAERIFYNIDGIRTSKECIIAEGEIDALTYMEIGRWDVVSLPNGASLKTVNLEYLDSAISYFENKDIIYLALDADEAGLNTQKELLRRLGADKCRLVDMRGYKDPNDILIAEGTRGVSLSIENAREVPIENVSSVGDWEDEYDYFLLNGMKQGYGIGKPYFDDVFTTYTGQFITVTGIPSCVTGDTEVLMEDGSYRQIKDVNKGDRIISISDEYKSESDVVSDKWSSGVKPVYEMELQSGKRLKATKEHKVMTFEGWKDLGDLHIGDFVAVQNSIHFDKDTVSVDHAKLIALWIAEGNKNHNSFYFSSGLDELVLDVRDICKRNKLRYSYDGEFGHIISEVGKLKMSKKRYISSISYTYRKRNGLNFDESVLKASADYSKRAKQEQSLFNPVSMLKKYGLIGMKTDTVRVPSEVFKQSNEILAHFLNYLFACDGNVSIDGLEYTSISRMLCVDIASLLSRFGITSYINLKKIKYNGGYNYAYTLSINGYENIKVFRDVIGVIGKNKRVDEYLDSCNRIVSSKLRDYVPSTVKKDFIHGDKYYKKYFGISISKNDKSKKRFSRRLAMIVAENEGNIELINKTSNNVRWEQITTLDYIGEVETYDIEVEKNHNFIANDIVVHNCGKSDFVDEMVIGYNKLYGWKVAYASPENKPNVIHASKIEAKLVGQWVRSEEQLKTNWHQRAKEHIHDNFKFIDLERYTLENVLSKAKEMIRRFGIKVLVIDPYNKIPLEGDKDSMSVSYTSEYLLKVDEFARNNDILIILVAHPRKPSFSDGKYIPTMYDIKGGGEFYDMSPHGLVVHRDFDNEASMVKVLKCKFSFLGETGAQTWFKWNKNNGRYSEFGVHGSEIEECSYVEYNDTNEFADDDEVEPIVQQQSEDLPW